jgi:hypothetical protein
MGPAPPHLVRLVRRRAEAGLPLPRIANLWGGRRLLADDDSDMYGERNEADSWQGWHAGSFSRSAAKTKAEVSMTDAMGFLLEPGHSGSPRVPDEPPEFPPEWWKKPPRTHRRGHAGECPVCGNLFEGTARRVFCTPACKQRAWRRRLPRRYAAQQKARRDRDRQRLKRAKELAGDPRSPLRERIVHVFDVTGARSLSTVQIAEALGADPDEVEWVLIGMPGLRGGGARIDARRRASQLWLRL